MCARSSIVAQKLFARRHPVETVGQSHGLHRECGVGLPCAVVCYRACVFSCPAATHGVLFKGEHHGQEPGRKEKREEGADQDTERKERSQATQKSRKEALMV